MTSALLHLTYDPPLAGRSPDGLYEAVTWVQSGEPTRWLASGVLVRPHNYGGEDAFGVWGEDWCGDPDDITTSKDGDRPDISSLTAFDPITVFGFDHNPCGDMHEITRNETRARAEQNLALLEQNAVETSFATRLLADATALAAATGIVSGISKLEAAMAATGTVGVIHAGAQWAAYMQSQRLLIGGKTPLGHQVVFGGGYVAALGTTLVATSPVLGWRSNAATRDTIQHDTNEYIAVAERSVLVGYEKAVAKVAVS